MISVENIPLSSELGFSSTPNEPLVDFIRVYDEIMAILDWLMECSPGVDPQITAVKRQRLVSLFQRLGLSPDDPNSFTILLECHTDTMLRATKPQPVIDIPNTRYFEKRIADIINTRSVPNVNHLHYPPHEDTTNLLDVISSSWVDWVNVTTRNPSSQTTAEYIKGIATIMADPTAYYLNFGQNPTDNLRVGSQWQITNGRHRALAALALGTPDVNYSGMSDWVDISVEY